MAKAEATAPPNGEAAKGDWHFSLGGGLGFQNSGLGVRGEVSKEHVGVSLGFGYPAGGVLGLRGYLGQGSGFFLEGEVGWSGQPIFMFAVGAGYRAQWEHLYLEAGLGIASINNFPEPQYHERITLPNVILGAGWRF